jgi:hypothetical protein
MRTEWNPEFLLILPLFMTSIENRGAHKSGERWKHEGNEGFRQVQASVRIITLHLCSGAL